jgi:HEAT repeat protein
MKRLAFVLASVLAAPQAHAWSFDWSGRVEVDAQGLTDTDADKRYEAVVELGKYDVSLTEKFLIAAMHDTSEKVQQAAAKALGNGGSVAAVPALVEWLGEPNPEMRKVAAEALGNIGGAEATTALTRSLGDVDDGVRAKAVRALGTIGKKGNPSVVIALIPRLEDPKTEVKNATIAQLEELARRRSRRSGRSAPSTRSTRSRSTSPPATTRTARRSRTRSGRSRRCRRPAPRARRRCARS